jgi:hypothetical protein
MAELVMGLFKTKLQRNPATQVGDGGPWKWLDDVEIDTSTWVSWFNEEQLQSEPGDRTPADVDFETETETECRDESQPNAACVTQTGEFPSNPDRSTTVRSGYWDYTRRAHRARSGLWANPHPGHRRLTELGIGDYSSDRSARSSCRLAQTFVPSGTPSTSRSRRMSADPPEPMASAKAAAVSP